MSMIERINNKINRIYSKHLIKTKSHVYKFGDVEIKYLFVPKRGSNVLLTAFSGMNPQRASYSYLNALNDVPYNRLYILDDYGDEVLGCYYLGSNKQVQVEPVVQNLIKEITEKLNIKKHIFCGSSKGGYAALNFGLEYPDSAIICGAPQYRLGYYLKCRKSPQLLYIIAGQDENEEYLNQLDSRLRDKVKNCSGDFGGTIHLHFSDKEHTYEEHVKYLVDDLKSFNYDFEIDCQSYPDHDSVGIYFPDYLKKVLSQIPRRSK